MTHRETLISRDIAAGRNYFPATTESVRGDVAEFCDFVGMLKELCDLVGMLKTIKHYVEALGGSNGYPTIMDQLEAMKRFHNRFANDPRYSGVEIKWHLWINDFSERFIKELHQELEAFVSANPKMREVKLGSANFYELVKGIRTYLDYSIVQNRVRLWFDKYDERPTLEQYECSIFLNGFLDDERRYANIVPREELKREVERIDVLITEAEAKLAATE